MTTTMYSEAVKELNPLIEILLKNRNAVADTLQVRIDNVCGNSICRLKNIQHQQMCWQKQGPKMHSGDPNNMVTPNTMVCIENSELLDLFFA